MFRSITQKRVFLLLLSVISCCHLFGQRIIVKGERTNRKLVWSDFTGKIDPASKYAALTYYTISFSVGNIRTEKGKTTISDLLITLKLDPDRSWSKPKDQTPELLAHEQGHFDIGVLCMYEMIERFNVVKIDPKNVNLQLENIFKEVLNKYEELGIKYDLETEHSELAVKQKEWELFLTKELEKRGHSRSNQ